MNEQTEKVIKTIDESIEKLNKKDFTIYFFVIDTKGTPNGSTQYIYETAKQLTELDYKCEFLHAEKDFVGVGEWMGEDYGNMKHNYVESDMVQVSASDFLIIPEIFANVMNQTKKLPCKRIVICQNTNYISEFIPIGNSWADYGLGDVITTTKTQADEIRSLFPFANINVIPPSIPNFFRDDNAPKKLIVSIVSKNQSDVNKIVKQFYWKYPQYKWLTFTDLRGLNREVFADVLRESAFTVWVDDDTYFGYTAVEAMKSGSFVIGKIPNVTPEWMYNENQTDFINNGIWFSDMRDVHKIIAQGVKLWMEDKMPEVVVEDMQKTAKKYTKESKMKELKEVFDGLTSNRISEMEKVKTKIINENK
jgi:hypothetical protein